MTTELHALSGAYALDAVDDIERAAFGRHLLECEPCRIEVAEFQEVAAKLTGADEPPPPSLRASVLAAVSQTSQVSATDPAPIVPAQRGSAPAVPARSAGRAERWRRATLGVAAAAVVAIAATWVVMDQRLSDERSERERIYAVMNARDVTMIGAPMPDGGRIAAAVSDEEHGGVAMLAGLSNPPAGQIYQMWVFTAGTPKSAALLPVGVSGGTLLFDWTAGDDAFGITREPEGGSDAPTMDPLAIIDLA